MLPEIGSFFSILLSRLFLHGLDGSGFITHIFYLPQNARTQMQFGQEPYRWPFLCCPEASFSFISQISVRWPVPPTLHHYSMPSHLGVLWQAWGFLHYLLLSFSCHQDHPDSLQRGLGFSTRTTERFHSLVIARFQLLFHILSCYSNTPVSWYQSQSIHLHLGCHS